MRKIVFIILGVLVVGGLIAVGVFIAPIMYWIIQDGYQSAKERRALLSRSDYSQIATACVSLTRSLTNESTHLKPTDPMVPGLLRSLSPNYISVSSNSVVMEFHGGFDHYGYRVRRSDTNAALWTISWYTEQSERWLATVSP